MGSVSVTTKGQVTIPKQIRQALGITPGTRVEFDVRGQVAELRVVKKRSGSRIDEGPAILNYRGPRIPTEQLDGGVAMRKAVTRAKR
ncbi:MAG TPA: AbrB/MazE/SpoVT family DNA-binding domain-containing protein [Burkholderiaceae bacterium]|jgi:antitoxin PrlF|nr:AbrB/MazE/SpoVT family DNA-binding domain-containing protein [Burkholderiaceae bacterium]